MPLAPPEPFLSNRVQEPLHGPVVQQFGRFRHKPQANRDRVALVDPNPYGLLDGCIAHSADQLSRQVT